MDHEEMRMECLKMALSSGHSGGSATKEAERLYNWIRGRGQSENTEVGSGSHRANVVGKDGVIDKPPFKDYKPE
jgi:hypothetical protein